ncbi:MAG: hypothetical protein MJK18_08135, partial [Bdellovibrionales bacterium]|nr:hypothetical protein [Bdellovibrionales bacterium]
MEDIKKLSHFCSMAFTGICIEAGGRHKPCCKYKDWCEDSDARSMSLKDLSQQSFYKNIREQFKKGEKPEGCQRCWDDEELGLVSMRQSYNRIYEEIIDKEDLEKPSFRILDYGFGNPCNAACITCFSGASSLWKKDDQWLKEYKNNKFNRHSFPVTRDRYPHWTSEDYSELVMISLAQNESLLSPEFEVTLDLLLSEKREGGIKFEISTNGSYVPNNRVIDKLLKF